VKGIGGIPGGDVESDGIVSDGMSVSKHLASSQTLEALQCQRQGLALLQKHAFSLGEFRERTLRLWLRIGTYVSMPIHASKQAVRQPARSAGQYSDFLGMVIDDGDMLHDNGLALCHRRLRRRRHGRRFISAHINLLRLKI
jgi:hypothetical protein